VQHRKDPVGVRQQAEVPAQVDTRSAQVRSLLGLIAFSEDEDALTAAAAATRFLAHGIVSLLMALMHCSLALLHM